MNIFWIVTDSICNYERSDLHGLLPVYNVLKNNNEGFYFEDCISQFPSTNLSLLSFLTGRFPYYIFPDYYRTIENLPSLEYENFISPLKKENYYIRSIIFGREQVEITKEIMKPHFVEELYQRDHWLDGREIYELFLDVSQDLLPNQKNLIFLFFRPSDPKANLYINKIIDYLKENNYWNDSIFILNSDHGYYDKNLYKKTKLLHFDDIHQSSMQPALFLKLPKNVTRVNPKVFIERVYLLDLMETILDYLNLKPTYKRESKSFKKLIEDNIDINLNRKIRGDCYLMFQSIKKTMIIQDRWKLLNDNGKFSLYDLKEDHLEKNDVSQSYPELYNDLYRFYLQSEDEAYNYFQSILNTLYQRSTLISLKSEQIFIPDQFPPQLVRFLRDHLKEDNQIIEKEDLKKRELLKDQKFITILFYNRLTGFGLKKLIKKYRKNTKRFIFLDTKLNDVSNQKNKTGFVKFVLRSIIARRGQLIQRWKEIVVWILYFPLYFNKHLRKYYK
jgi:hypothetical protein